MAKAKSTRVSARRRSGNQRRERVIFGDVMKSARRKANEQENRRTSKREMKSVWAAVAADPHCDPLETGDWGKRFLRWLFAALLLPLCWVTTWTFLSRFSHATVDQGFWQTSEFWYFAVGGLVMTGWFATGVLHRWFLLMYVLGHELTHAIFVFLFRGRVTDFHVSAEGGYITTNKSNLLIALSPYFVPFWSLVIALVYVIARLSVADPPRGLDLALYGSLGFTWTFHMAWTLWMLPRDQPDLRENGTLLSLVVIYLANIVLLVGLQCLASEAPLRSMRDFGMEWFRHAATWGDVALRHAVDWLRAGRAAAGL